MKSLLAILAVFLVLSPAFAPNTADTASSSGYYTTDGIWLSSECISLCHTYNYKAELTNEGTKAVDSNCYNLCIQKGKLVPTESEKAVIDALPAAASSGGGGCPSDDDGCNTATAVPTLISASPVSAPTDSWTCAEASDCEVNAKPGCSGYWKCVEKHCKYVCEDMSSTSASSGGASVAASVQFAKVCHVDESLMKEYDTLIQQLKSLPSGSDDAKAVEAKITELKKKIEGSRICEEVSIRPEAAIASGVETPVIDKCAELSAWREKLNYYEKLGQLGQTTAVKQGFSISEIARIAMELKAGVARIEKECASQTAGQVTSITTLEKPVLVEHASEITDYYKAKISSVVKSNTSVDEQISSLKQLRGDIDTLIERLVKEKQKFSYGDMKDIVKEIEVSPGNLMVDNTNVSSSDKEISTEVNGKEVKVKQFKGAITMEDSGQVVLIKAASIKIEDGNLNLGNGAILVLPSDALATANILPTNMTIETQDDKPVYKISAEEAKKFLWVIPVNLTQHVVIDASNGDVVSRTAPWWSGLAFS